MVSVKKSCCKKITTVLSAIAIFLFSNALIASGTPQYLGEYCFESITAQKTLYFNIDITYTGGAYYSAQGSVTDSSNGITASLNGSAMLSGINIIITGLVIGIGPNGLLSSGAFLMQLNSQLNGSYASEGTGFTTAVTPVGCK